MTIKPALAITMGDVNGVGPEILAKALQRRDVWDVCRPVIFGGVDAYADARRWAPDAPSPVLVKDVRSAPYSPHTIGIIEADCPAPPLRIGHVEGDAGACAVTWLKSAVSLALLGDVDAIVTCPISKEGIRLGGCPYNGHTDLIADMTHSPDYRMCLFTDSMRIVHISSHFSLRDALALVKQDRIARTIRIGHDALVRLGLPRRRIAVAGLNPHAGEAGILGREEIEEIRPAIEACAAQDINCDGPYPPDTVFRRMHEGEFDMVIGMYHDQGHIPLKLIAMDEGVNVTLGIPIVRTSVDHGTAYDIAGTGRAREASLLAAIRLAAQFTACRPAQDGRNTA